MKRLMESKINRSFRNEKYSFNKLLKQIGWIVE